MEVTRRWTSRKLWMGMVYLVGCFFLLYEGIDAGSDLTGLGVAFGGIATGVAAVVWGNVQAKKNGGA